MAKGSTNSTAATDQPNIEGLEFEAVGENVQVAVDGEWVYVAFNTAHRGGLSSSGKSVTVASTRGNQKVGTTGVILGLNAYIKP